MTTRTVNILRMAFAVVAICLGAIQTNADDNWPQFRGAQASGIGSGSPPVSWTVDTGENIRWKIRIEGLGHSSPIVWGDRIFLTTAISADTDDPALETGWIGGTGDPAADTGEWTWQVLCIEASTGTTLWTKDAIKREPTIKRHLKASHANCTPATDGQNVVAFFGSEGLYCYDMDGNLKWSKDLGRLHSGPYNAEELEWGFASSPVIYDGKVIVQCDCLNTGFIGIYDIENGNEIRRIERADVSTWSTPNVVSAGGKTQLICNGYKQIASYDFETGEQIWTISGGGDVPVPTPLFDDGIFFITNGHGRSPTFAVSADARGDLTLEEESEEKKDSGKDGEKAAEVIDENDVHDQALPEGLVWYQPRDGSYMPTPIIVNGRLYTGNDNGRLTVRDCKTGEEVYKQRVGEDSGTYSASAVSAGGNLYFSSESGKITVVKAGDAYEQLAENEMGERVMATPALTGDTIIVRGVKHLFCIAQQN